MRHTFATTLLDNGNDLKTALLMSEGRELHNTDDRKVEAIRNLQFGVTLSLTGVLP